MNIRKPTDYSILFSELDRLMAEQLSQMNLYCETGRLVSSRAEKGAGCCSVRVPANDLSCGRGLFSPQPVPYARVLRSLRRIP